MITESYINKLIEQYAKSPAGRAAIKKKTGIEYVDKDPTAAVSYTHLTLPTIGG